MNESNVLHVNEAMPDRLLRLRDVLELTALSRATLYREIDQGAFPRPIKFGSAARWPVSDVTRYIDARIRTREEASRDSRP